MPFISIQAAGPALSPAERTTLQQETTRLMNEVMGKNRALTAVRVEEGPAENWSVGGKAQARAGHMDIKVTAGTNSEAEKAAMVEAGHRLLVEVLGALPEASYVVIHELQATSWGYAGRTQADRLAGPKAATG